MPKSNQVLSHPVKILAIHDLSGYSQVSLMAIIPIMSAFGIRVGALPTAVLSTNTEFEGFKLVDMSGHLQAHLNHWKQLKLSFTAVYSGFLGTVQAARIVTDYVRQYAQSGKLVVVDPVMGDDGQLYPCFGKPYVSAIRKLIEYATIITPNLTEAAFLLRQPVHDLNLSELQDWLLHLANLGPRHVIITGIKASPITGHKNKALTMGLGSHTGEYFAYEYPHYPVNYPGTGDIFTSIVTAYILRGCSIKAAVHQALKFLDLALTITMKNGTPTAEGIALQECLGYLKVEMLNKLIKEIPC